MFHLRAQMYTDEVFDIFVLHCTIKAMEDVSSLMFKEL